MIAKKTFPTWLAPTLLIWALLCVLVTGAAVIFGANNIIICWDGLEVDDELMLEKCGFSGEAYFQDTSLLDDCPEGREALRMVGGCQPDWPVITGMAAALLLVFNLVFWMLFVGVYFAFLRQPPAEEEPHSRPPTGSP